MIEYATVTTESIGESGGLGCVRRDNLGTALSERLQVRRRGPSAGAREKIAGDYFSAITAGSENYDHEDLLSQVWLIAFRGGLLVESPMGEYRGGKCTPDARRRNSAVPLLPREAYLRKSRHEFLMNA